MAFFRLLILLFSFFNLLSRNGVSSSKSKDISSRRSNSCWVCSSCSCKLGFMLSPVWMLCRMPLIWAATSSVKFAAKSCTAFRIARCSFLPGWTVSCRRISCHTRCDSRTARRFVFCRGYSKSPACKGCRSHRRPAVRSRHICCYSDPGGACVGWPPTCCFGGQSRLAPLGISAC